MLALLVLAACGPPPPPPPPREGPPSVVIVVIDTLRADHMGAWGATRDTSPELDQLAAEGQRFSHAWAPTSWTRPSVGALLTGQSPRQLGIREEQGDMLPKDVTTLAERMRDAGYATFGMTANPNLNSLYGFDRGFDTYINSDVVFQWMLTDGAEGVTAVDNPMLRADDIFKKSLGFAREHSAEPSFLFLDLMEVHEHYQSASKTLLRPEYQDLFHGTNAKYDATIRQTSADLGAFVRTLAGVPGWEDCVVIITSDHGEGLGDHPDTFDGEGHGRYLYNSQVAVPLLVWNPKGTHGTGVVDRPVTLLDIAPTVLALSGLPPATLSATGLPGQPLLPGQSPGATAEPRPYIGFETLFRDVDKVGVTDGTWLYVENRLRDPSTPAIELQRVRGSQNGAATSQHESEPDALAGMVAFLQQYEAATPRREPTKTPRPLSKAEADQLKAIGYLE
jgi:arylsulfatase A-like enzyme